MNETGRKDILHYSRFVVVIRKSMLFFQICLVQIVIQSANTSSAKTEYEFCSQLCDNIASKFQL